jgi:hypothetical protein
MVRDVNGSDQIFLLSYPLTCFFVEFKADRIMIEYGFKNR